MRRGMPSACPSCGQIDHVQHVSAIVRSDHGEFAQAMAPAAPPPAPQFRRGIGCVIVGAGWFVPAVILSITVRASLPIAIMIGFGVPGAYGIYHFWGKHRLRLQQKLRIEDHEDQMRHHGETLEIWDRFEYCHRCHGIFLPDNEWQFEVNREHDLIHHNNAWWYATKLAGHRRQQSAPVLVSDRGPLATTR